MNQTHSIIHWLAGSLRYRTLLMLLVATELVDDLREPGPWVVLAPTDDTFARFLGTRLEELWSAGHAEDLADLAENHVCRTPDDGRPLVSLLGERIAPFLSSTVGKVVGHGAPLRSCANGVVVEVEQVALPRCWAVRARRPRRRAPRFDEIIGGAADRRGA